MRKRKQISAVTLIGDFVPGYYLSGYLQNQMWGQLKSEVGYGIAIGVGYYGGRLLENMIRKAFLAHG